MTPPLELCHISDMTVKRVTSRGGRLAMTSPSHLPAW